MKRLTERMADGTAQPNCSRCKHYKACGDEYYCDDNESCYEKIFEQLCIYEEKIKNGEILIMPCKEGTVLYEIRKCCESTGQKTRWKKGYQPLTEITTDCTHYEPEYYESAEECRFDKENRDWDERDYCSLNLDICCQECADRLVVWETTFKIGDWNKVYGTPQFDKSTPLHDTLFLTINQAKRKIKALKKLDALRRNKQNG